MATRRKATTRAVSDPREALIAADPILGAHIEHIGPYGLVVDPLDAQHGVYRALTHSIVGQQLTGKAAATIHGRLCTLGAAGLPTPHEVLALDVSALRGVGLSGAKSAALIDLAAHVVAGKIPDTDELADLDDDEIVRRLTVIRGIGPWSVQMLLMFRLGRPDVLPVLDYGVKKGFQRLYGGEALPTPTALTAAAERWRPFRSMASWYLWRANERSDLADL
jgi:DNA-3-methyladenine glycosylase II